jgi:alkylation response protein AidB-like acyl-CoA dehydrogenase
MQMLMATEFLDELRATTRAALSRGGDRDVVNELGLAGLLVDADLNGLGLGDREAVLVSEELGRALSPSSFVPSAVLAVTLLAQADTKDAASVRSAVCDGQNCCAVALSGDGGRWHPESTQIVADTDDTGTWQLSGAALGIASPDVAAVSVVIVTARTPEGSQLFAVQAGDAEFVAADALDPSRGFTSVRLNDAPALRLAGSEATLRAVSGAYRRGLLTISAEQVGIARASLDSAVEYAKTRRQFGAVIGSFQAIKHRCADVLLEVECADALLTDAVERGATADAELAFVVATHAAIAAAEACIHIHGGIGFTWEHPAHRYLRRARVNAALMGPSEIHRDAIAESIGLAAESGALAVGGATP